MRKTPFIDLHAVSGGGGTALTEIGTIALGGDGQVVAGVPVDATKGIATLYGWGVLTTIADTIAEVKLASLDQEDTINGEDFTPGASSLLGIVHRWTNLKFQSGKRKISIDQNTAGANCLGYYLDGYPDPQKSKAVFLKKIAAKRVEITQVFGGALTAITWGTQGFAPTNNLPNGKYAILGARVGALTNYALLRFQHADFGNFMPGFPVTDQQNTALANANVPKDELFLNNGYQFGHISEVLGAPCMPVFTAGSNGSGLTLWMLSITTDTPVVTLNLAKVAD